MALTPAQQATLKADIAADPVLSAKPNTSDGAFDIAAAYNLLATPDWIVWKTVVTPEEYRQAVTWTEVDALTAGKARIWEWLTGNMLQPFDASKTAIRQGVADCWASNSATRPLLLAASKRKATRAEKLFSTGTGSDATPATMTFEGNLSYQDVQAARNS